MQADEIQTEIYKKMSPAQKLRIANDMMISARKLKAAWLRQNHPDWTEEQIKQAVKEAFMNART